MKKMKQKNLRTPQRKMFKLRQHQTNLKLRKNQIQLLAIMPRRSMLLKMMKWVYNVYIKPIEIINEMSVLVGYRSFLDSFGEEPLLSGTIDSDYTSFGNVFHLFFGSKEMSLHLKLTLFSFLWYFILSRSQCLIFKNYLKYRAMHVIILRKCIWVINESRNEVDESRTIVIDLKSLFIIGIIYLCSCCIWFIIFRRCEKSVLRPRS